MPQTPDLSKYLDAGAEFVALTRSQARERAQELVKQGELSKNQVTGFVDGLVEESRRRTDFFMDVVRQEIQRQVQAVGIATKDDLVKLEAKLAKQTKAAKQPGAKAPSAKAGTKTAGTKKAGKKKAAAKKSGTTAAKKTKKAKPKPASSTRAAAAS